MMSLCVQMYGMTEAGVIAMNDPARRETCKPGTVGLPLDGYEMGVLRPDGSFEKKPGEIGEICVRGDNMFAGYHNRPRENREAFVGEAHLFPHVEVRTGLGQPTPPAPGAPAHSAG